LPAGNDEPAGTATPSASPKTNRRREKGAKKANFGAQAPLRGETARKWRWIGRRKNAVPETKSAKKTAKLREPREARTGKQDKRGDR
jgi:hypothetical protein